MLFSKTELDFQRQLEIIKEPEKMAYLIDKHFSGTLQVSGYKPAPEAKIIKRRGLNHIVVDLGSFIPTVGNTYTLHRVSFRYIHVRGRIVQDKVDGGHHYSMLLEHVAVAKQQRDSQRIPIEENEIFISNIRVSRSEIKTNTPRLPTSVKLGLEELKNSLKGRADYIDVQIYDTKSSLRDFLFGQVCKSGKPLLVRDALDANSYQPFNHSYYDYAAYLGNELQQKIAEHRRKGIVSEMCVPVLYMSHDQTPIPLGYVYMQSKSRSFSPEEVKEISDIVKDTIKRIRESNTILIRERENVIDISHKGLRLLVRNEQLIENLRKQKNFTFDLFFHLQAPITIYGIIRSFRETGDGAEIGVQIQGNSSRPNEMQRLHDNISSMEKKIL